MLDFKEQVKKGFTACKEDIEFLKSENNFLKDEITKLNNTISELRGEIKGIGVALEYIKDFKKQNEIKKVNEIKQEVEISQQPSISKKISQNQNNQDPYEALLAFKAKANKRDVLKQKIVSMIGEGGISLSELKFMFVEYFKYCSKATFYNYLKELEIEKIIKIERENSKNIVMKNSVSQEI